MGLGRHVRRLARSWSARVAVAGHSMEPMIRQGDWLLVDPDAYRGRAPVRGDLVVAPDPRQEQRLLVKRVAAVTSEGGLLLAGDAPHASTDWRTFGALAPDRVLGRPWFRYWPVGRIGRVS